MRLYSKYDLPHIPWPTTEQGQYAKSYLTPLLENGTASQIANVQTAVFILIINDKAIPVTASLTGTKNCYVCDPIEHYISYSIAELTTLKNKFLIFPLKCMLAMLNYFLTLTQFNRVVYINNWLLSTNLYPDIDHNEYQQIITFIQQKFPTRTILFRSLNKCANSNEINILKTLGCKKIVSRQLYMNDMHRQSYKKKRDYKTDKKRLNNTPYQIVTAHKLTGKQYQRVIDLYNQLYLDKYFNLNPHFTINFIKKALLNDYLQVKLLVKNGTIYGVLGYFIINDNMTCPLFGYDTTQPVSEGLYRLLSALLLADAEEKRVRFFNQSSGAASFKRLRGATPYIEYTLFNTLHSPIYQKIAWATQRILANAIAIPLLRKYKL